MTSNPSYLNTPNIEKPKGSPSKLLLFTEGARAALDLGAYALTRRMLTKAPKGDGHPILVVPGFMTNDFSTVVLRNFLEKLGYAPKTWDLGFNLGRPEYAFRLMDRLEEIQAAYNCKVSIIGWSLGGVFAREVAREKPELVRQVITLGSPFGGIFEKNNARWLYEFLHGAKAMDVHHELVENILTPPPVPTTAIYSKGDGVVNWQHCLELEESATVQNIEVSGSHIGLGVNPSVLYCLGDRLAQEHDDWQRFQPKGGMKLFYHYY